MKCCEWLCIPDSAGGSTDTQVRMPYLIILVACVPGRAPEGCVSIATSGICMQAEQAFITLKLMHPALTLAHHLTVGSADVEGATFSPLSDAILPIAGHNKAS